MGRILRRLFSPVEPQSQITSVSRVLEGNIFCILLRKRIVNSQLSADIKMKNFKIGTSFLSQAWTKGRAKKAGFNFMIFILIINIHGKLSVVQYYT